jgi:hypothetical protein
MISRYLATLFDLVFLRFLGTKRAVVTLVPCTVQFFQEMTRVVRMDREQQKSRLEQQIDENLRKVYHANDPQEDVPDRFLQLLQQLKEQELSEEGSSQDDA